MRDMLIALVIGGLIGLVSASFTEVQLEIELPGTDEVVTFRHYLPKEPAQQRMLTRQQWDIPQLLSKGLGITSDDVISANASGSEWQSGSWINIQIPEGHTWEACASYYGLDDGTHGAIQANGKPFDAYGISVASKELPKGSTVTVEFVEFGVIVKEVEVTDSGPYYATCNRYPELTRSFDLSWGLMWMGHRLNKNAAQSAGLAHIKVTLESLPDDKIVE